MASALDGALDIGMPTEHIHDPDVGEGEPKNPWDGAHQPDDEDENTNVVTLSDDYDEVELDEVELIEELEDMEILEFEEEGSARNEPARDDSGPKPRSGGHGVHRRSSR